MSTLDRAGHISDPRSEIMNAAWWVRHYSGRRSARAQRADAINNLGLIVRRVICQSDDFELILGSLLSGLSTKDDEKF